MEMFRTGAAAVAEALLAIQRCSDALMVSSVFAEDDDG